MRKNQQDSAGVQASGQCSTRWVMPTGKRLLRVTDDDIVAVARQLVARRVVATLDQPLHMNLAVRDYVALCLAGLRVSVDACLYLDARDELIAIMELSDALPGQGPGLIEKVVKRALATQAKSVVLIARRPGPLRVEYGYQREFKELRELLALIGVRVLGQLTIGEDGGVSVAERGSL